MTMTTTPAKPEASRPPAPRRTSEGAACENAATRFLDLLSRAEFDRLEECMAENIWFRALLPRRVREHNNSRDVVEAFRGWFGDAEEIHLVAAEHHTMAGREHISYRFRLRPRSAPAEWYIVEQAGFCRVKDGLLSRLDIVCTGFFPMDAPPRQPTEAAQ